MDKIKKSSNFNEIQNKNNKKSLSIIKETKKLAEESYSKENTKENEKDQLSSK